MLAKFDVDLIGLGKEGGKRGVWGEKATQI